MFISISYSFYTNVVTKDNNGMVTAIAPGKAFIIVTTQYGNKTDLCNVIVTTHYAGITLSPESSLLEQVITSTLTITMSVSGSTSLSPVAAGLAGKNTEYQKPVFDIAKNSKIFHSGTPRIS